MSRLRFHNPRQRGWVTVEMAFAALGLGLVISLCAGGLGLGLAQIQCHDAASEIARQAARDDLAAVKEVSERLPDSSHVDIRRDGGNVVVTVTISVRPWGSWLPAIQVRSEASVAREGSG